MNNVGSLDRIVRILLGSGMLAMVFFGPQTPWGWIGIVPIFTALVGWCPLYTAAGISTRGRRVEQAID